MAQGSLIKVWSRRKALSGDLGSLQSGWLQTDLGQLLLPGSQSWKVIKSLHQVFHLGRDKSYQLVKKYLLEKFVKNGSASNFCLWGLSQKQCSWQKTCSSRQSKDWRLSWRRLTIRLYPYAKIKRFPVSVVWVGNFTTWVKTFPCRTEKAHEVIRVLLHEIIPRVCKVIMVPPSRLLSSREYQRPWE